MRDEKLMTKGEIVQKKKKHTPAFMHTGNVATHSSCRITPRTSRRCIHAHLRHVSIVDWSIWGHVLEFDLRGRKFPSNFSIDAWHTRRDERWVASEFSGQTACWRQVSVTHIHCWFQTHFTSHSLMRVAADSNRVHPSSVWHVSSPSSSSSYCVYTISSF